jgi:hypothetical protein
MGQRKLVYSDHFPCLLTFHNLPRGREEKEEKGTKWNIAKEGGWERYKKGSDEMIEKVKESIEDECKSVEDAKKVFDKVHYKIRFKAFGKVTLNNKDHKASEEVDGGEKPKDMNEKEKAEELFREQQRRAAEEVDQIENTAKSKVGKVWEIKKVILGGKKATQEKSAIVNPKTGKLAVSKTEIKKVSLQYCMQTMNLRKGLRRRLQEKRNLCRIYSV